MPQMCFVILDNQLQNVDRFNIGLEIGAINYLIRVANPILLPRGAVSFFKNSDIFTNLSYLSFNVTLCHICVISRVA